MGIFKKDINFSLRFASTFATSDFGFCTSIGNYNNGHKNHSVLRLIQQVTVMYATN